MAGAWLLLVVVLAFWAAWIVMLARTGEAEPFPLIDFFTFWAASSLALDGVASTAYEAEAIWQAEAQLVGDDSGFLAWLNPPTFFFVVLPFALVPVAVSYVAWVVLSGGLLFTAVYRIAVDKPLAMLLAVTFPAGVANLLLGHNGFFIAGMFAWGMLLLRDRPVLSGAMLGLLALKPQFFPLVLVALIAAREYRAAASAIACVALLCLASVPAFGVESWTGFAEAGERYAALLYEGTLDATEMQSLSAVLLLMSVPDLATRVAQLIVAAACAAFVWWLWRTGAPFEYRAAGLAIATLLATPYSYMYDLTMLGLAALWLACAFQRDGWWRWDGVILAATWISPAAFLVVGFSVVPFVLMTLMLVLAGRLPQPRSPRGPATPVVIPA